MDADLARLRAIPGDPVLVRRTTLHALLAAAEDVAAIRAEIRDWMRVSLAAAEAEVARLTGFADALATAADGLLYAMAETQPLREPETHTRVLAAWDALDQARDAYRAARGTPTPEAPP
jgi:hypothetical protein